MSRILDIGTQFLDANGDPLSGGKLQFYDTGTTNPKTTYSDSALSSANTNPVILGADGVPGNIFYSGDAKVVLSDSADVQMRTMDPVESCCSTGGTTTSYWTFDTTEKTSSFTGVAGSFYFVDLSGGNLTMTLPATPTIGDRIGVRISDLDINYSLTLGRNSSNIERLGSDYSMTWGLNENGVSLIYLGTTPGWIVYDNVYKPNPT
tara:strand:- start:1053 stop:1670 length:618 start_codon:yes stop_codon:yes gene_type:complete